MKPVIGICTNYTSDETVGLITDLGAKGQDWDLVAHDYVRAVEMAGGSPLILPVAAQIENLEPVLHILDGIILTGGSDIDPGFYGEQIEAEARGIETVRDIHEIALTKKVLEETEIPVMGICRGIQLLNVACGGTLYQDLGQQRPDSLDHNTETYPKYYISHELELTDGSFLMSVFQQRTIGVNSLHHQGIKTLGQGLTATAFATDGLIEGIELPGKRCVFGVQFHPEMMIDHDPEMRKFFEIFIKQATWRV